MFMTGSSARAENAAMKIKSIKRPPHQAFDKSRALLVVMFVMYDLTDASCKKTEGHLGGCRG